MGTTKLVYRSEGTHGLLSEKNNSPRIPGRYLSLCKWGLQFKGFFVGLFNRSLKHSNLNLKLNVSHHKINKLHKEETTSHYIMPMVNLSPTQCIIQFLVILRAPVKEAGAPLRDCSRRKSEVETGSTWYSLFFECAQSSCVGVVGLCYFQEIVEP